MERTKAADQWRLSDTLWGKIQPLLPIHVNTHRCAGGKPRKPDRVCADAIFFRLRTGCQWKALDATGLCPGSTAHDRFQEWVAADVFLKLWRAGLLAFEELKGIDWSWLSMDGCMTKAPLGGEKTGKNPTDRGKRGVKRSLLVDSRRVPVGLAVDGANRNDFELLRQTLESLPVARPRADALAPQGLCLDKGYDDDEVRQILKEFGFRAHIRARGEEARAIQKEAGYKARRWVVERTHIWLNRFRAILIRRCKKPENYIAHLHFAFALVTYRVAQLSG